MCLRQPSDPARRPDPRRLPLPIPLANRFFDIYINLEDLSARKVGKYSSPYISGRYWISAGNFFISDVLFWALPTAGSRFNRRNSILRDLFLCIHHTCVFQACINRRNKFIWSVKCFLRDFEIFRQPANYVLG